MRLVRLSGLPAARRLSAGRHLAAVLAVAFLVSACGGGSGGTPSPVPAHSASTAASASPPDSPAPAQSTAESQSPSPSPSATSAYLADLTPVKGDAATGNSTVNGRDFVSSISNELNPGPAEVSYDLGRSWQHLQATVGLEDDAPENAKVQFRVFADGRSVYSRILGLGQTKSIALDVTGVLRLRLVMTLLSDYAGPVTAVWGNAGLTH
jgi:NPCBM/NEW2 domain